MAPPAYTLPDEFARPRAWEHGADTSAVIAEWAPRAHPAVVRLAPMPRLLLVRHAQSDNNVSSARARQRYATDPLAQRRETARARQADPGLSALGREQLSPLTRRLEPVAREPSTLLVTSPMRRTLDTAAAIAAAAELPRARFVCVGDLYEIGGCHYCGRAEPSASAAQIERDWPVRCERVDPAGWYAGYTHIESAEQAAARVARIIAWADAQLGSARFATIIVVAHGDLLSRWLREWLGVLPGRKLAFAHANTGVTTLDWHAEHGLQLRGLNDTSHLPAELVSGAEVEAWWRYAEPDRARAEAALALDLSEASG